MRAARLGCILSSLLLSVSTRGGVGAWTTNRGRRRRINKQLWPRGQSPLSARRGPSLCMTTTMTDQGEETTATDLVRVLTETSPLPKLLVFDLDATLWYPELYQIRQEKLPVVGQQIHLFSDVVPILQALRQMEKPPLLAVASRTTKTEWAHQLLRDFQINSDDEPTSLSTLMTHVEIQPGSKKTHFANLRQATGLAYSEMMFFDDDARMNLQEISGQLGVMSCHTPRGLTLQHFAKAVQKYAQLKAGHDASHWMGHILNDENLGIPKPASSAGQVLHGRVKFYSPAKRFGFVIDQASGQDYFVHESKVPAGMRLQAGDAVSFEAQTDAQGRLSAVIVSQADAANSKATTSSSSRSSSTATTTMPCFSMSQPFAALLLNGVKTVESRNNPMFQDVAPGTQVLLHCGRKDWHDLESYRDILAIKGMTESEIYEKGRLPRGFRRRNVVGVVTVGKTWRATDAERKGRDLQHRVLAPYEGVGKFCTEITNAAWLTESVQAPGSPGIYNAEIPVDCLPK